MQNGVAESFIGNLRDECLDEALFTSLAHARFVLDAWRDVYGSHSNWAGRPLRDRGPTCFWGFPSLQPTIMKERDFTSSW